MYVGCLGVGDQEADGVVREILVVDEHNPPQLGQPPQVLESSLHHTGVCSVCTVVANTDQIGLLMIIKSTRISGPIGPIVYWTWNIPLSVQEYGILDIPLIVLGRDMGGLKRVQSGPSQVKKGSF